MVKILAIKTYSLKKDGNTKLSENFIVKEFACKDGSDKILIDTELVKVLQKIRDHFGKPITINSAYRNATYNKKIGGASKSQHILGTASDIVVKGVAPLKVAQYAESLLDNSGGIGLYKTFTHVDVRTKKVRWDNTSGKEVSVSDFGGNTETYTESIDFLSKKGYINSPDIWKTKAKNDKDIEHLLRKFADAVR